MDSVGSIASSGMFAAEQRLNVAAINIANSTDDTNTFQPLSVDQTQTPGGGTAVRTRVQFPNDTGTGVDLPSEAIQLVTARYTFAANVAVMRSDAQLQQTLLDTFA